MRTEQLRQFRRRQTDEPDAVAARAHRVRPRRLVPVVHERAEHDRDVRVDDLPTRPSDVVAILREDP